MNDISLHKNKETCSVMVGIETARPSPSYYVLLVAIGSCQMGNPYIFFRPIILLPISDN